MDRKLFDEVVESVREGGEILVGKKPPSRSFELEKSDLKHIDNIQTEEKSNRYDEVSSKK